MPYMVNGIGTTVYQGRGNVGWGSFDAVEWFVIGFAPIIPLRTIHTFGWKGSKYQLIPIRWSWILVLRSFLHAWHWFFIVVGCIMLALGILLPLANNQGQQVATLVLAAVGGSLAVVGAVLHFVLARTDRRADDIRRLLGPYQLGSCDPASMRKPMNPVPREVFGADSYADAVPALLEADRFSRAMWAARLAVAWEDAALGEQLTDYVLRHPGVPEALEQVRRKPRCWSEVMLSPADHAEAASRAETSSKPRNVAKAEGLISEFARPAREESARAVRAGDALARKNNTVRRADNEYDPPPRSNQGLIIGLAVGGAILVVFLALGGAALLYLLVWKGPARQPVAPVPVLLTPPRALPSHFLLAHNLPARFMIVNPAGTIIVSSDQHTLKLWDPAAPRPNNLLINPVLKNDAPLALFSFPQNLVSALAFSPDGMQLAVGLGGDAVELRDGRTGNLLPGRTVRLNQGVDPTGAVIPDRRPTRCLAFSADGKLLAIGRGGDVHLWDLEAGKDQRLLKAHADAVQALAFSPDGKTLATAGRDNLVKLWNADSWTERYVMRGHTKDITALSFSADGTRLASAGSDALVIVWDAAGKEKGRLTGHTGAVLGVAYSHDGKLLATCSADAGMRLWDAQTFTERWRIDHPEKLPVDAIAFDPNGNTLYASYAGMIQFWETAKLLGP